MRDAKKKGKERSADGRRHASGVASSPAAADAESFETPPGRSPTAVVSPEETLGRRTHDRLRPMGTPFERAYKRSMVAGRAKSLLGTYCTPSVVGDD